MGDDTGGAIAVNRAPVLTLWAAIVAERLGYDWESALTLGQAVAGLNAQSKGRALGIYHAKPAAPTAAPARPAPGPELRVPLLGREVPAARTPEGVRAVEGGRPTSPASVERYLERAFRGRLAEARSAMEDLARAYPPEQLADAAYGLYERFRPRVAPGVRGWGQRGALDLEQIRALAPRA